MFRIFESDSRTPARNGSEGVVEAGDRDWGCFEGEKICYLARSDPFPLNNNTGTGSKLGIFISVIIGQLMT